MVADQVRFDLQRLLAERGIRADVDRSGPMFPAEDAPACIYAGARQERVDAVEIGGGKADFRPARGAVPHDAADAIGPGEQSAGLVDAALGDQSADARTADDVVVEGDRLNGLERDTGFAAEPPQDVDRAYPI